MDRYHFHFCDQNTNVDIQQLKVLLQSSAFWAADRTETDLVRAIANSKPVMTVWDRDQQIGFARATSDGVYRAAIWDVVIHPNYQKLGLGRQLIENLLSHPRLQLVEKVYLMTSQQQGFYERIGFIENPSTTMLMEHQSLVKSAFTSKLKHHSNVMAVL